MKRVEFKLPEGFELPEGDEPTFESMATFQMKSDGKLCLVAIGEHKLAGYDNSKEDGPNAGGDVAQKYRAALGTP